MANRDETVFKCKRIETENNTSALVQCLPNLIHSRKHRPIFTVEINRDSKHNQGVKLGSTFTHTHTFVFIHAEGYSDYLLNLSVSQNGNHKVDCLVN